jgi:hypothetical protein
MATLRLEVTTMTKKTGGLEKPHAHGGVQHPARWREDLNPAPTAGQNLGVASTPASATSAYDLKEVHDLLRDYPDEDLKRIPVLAPATRLAQGATYYNLRHPERGAFGAMGDEEVSADDWFLAKKEVDYPLWNRLIGMAEPERLS